MPADDSNLTPWQIACKKYDEARDAALEHYTNAPKFFPDDMFEAEKKYNQAINIAREEWERARELVRHKKHHHAHDKPDETGHGDHNDNNDDDDIDEILSEASVASAVESLVKASANLERLGFKRGAAEALTIASIVVEAKKKKDNKKKMKMKMKMMREKMMKDKKDSSSKNSKSDSSKSNSSSSIPEFLKKKIKFAQVSDPKLAPYKNISRRFIDFINDNSDSIPAADLLKIKPALYRFKESIGSYTSNEIYRDVTNIIDMISNISGRENSKVEEFKNKAQSYKVMFNQPSDDLSRINLIEKINPAYLETLQAPPKELTIKSAPASYSQYVNQLDTGLKFLINKIGPTSDSKISGQDRAKYLNQLNTIIKEINRVDAILSKQNSAESQQLQDKLLTMNQSLRTTFSGDDVSKLPALNQNASKLSGQPSTTVPQQPSAEQVKSVQDYAANLAESFGAPAVTRPGTT
jgi:hypothetical protein